MNKYKWMIFITIFFVSALLFIRYNGYLRYYFKKIIHKKDKIIYTGSFKGGSDQAKFNEFNTEILSDHLQHIFGIDVSQHQGNISWSNVKTILNKYPIHFVFVRATNGIFIVDKRFYENWESLRSTKFLQGAYHYYQPNQNSTLQAENFMSIVKMRAGDLPPVLDIEEHPKDQSFDQLKVGLKNWLKIVEKHYGVRPIIYSGDTYFSNFLMNEFKEYIIWNANYNFWNRAMKNHWDIWQFSERGLVDGIPAYVDLNIFNGDLIKLQSLTKRNK